MARGKSRPQRWQAAAAEARKAIAKIEDALGELNAARETLEDLRTEYEEWRDNLPENLQQSALGEKLDAIVSIETGNEVEAPEVDWLDEAENADLPQGFGRD